MEPLLPGANRSQKDRLRRLPLFCSVGWEQERPIHFLDVPELRGALAKALPGHRFWTPPCDVRDLPNLVETTRVTDLRPALRVVDETVGARERGEVMRPRFRRSPQPRARGAGDQDQHRAQGQDQSKHSAKPHPSDQPRTLKESVGTPAPAEIIPGGPPKPATVRGRRPLSTTPPPPSPSSPASSSSFIAYTTLVIRYYAVTFPRLPVLSFRLYGQELESLSSFYLYS